MANKVRGRVSSQNIPFFVVVASTFMPTVASFFHVWLYNFPLALVAIGLVVSATTKRGVRLAPFDRPLFFTGIFLGLALIIQTLRGNGFIILALGGQLILFTFAFLQFFGRAEAKVDAFIKQISVIYKIHVVAIAFEAVIVVSGGQNVLVRLFNGSPPYKNYNPADVLRLVVPQVGGLNSLLLGSQGAGMLMLFAFVWFLNPLRLRSRTLHGRRARRWCIAAAALFVISYTQTGISLLVVALLMLIYVIKASALYRPRYQFVVFPAIVAIFAAMIPFLFHRVLREGTLLIEGANTGITTFEYYLVAFLDPVFLWLNLSHLDQLWGAAYQFSSLEFADSGYFTTMFLAGILWVLVITTLVLWTCFKTFRDPVGGAPSGATTVGRLAIVNALLSFLWFCSIFHYLPAFLLGGVELFAFHFALTIYCWEAYKTAMSAGTPTGAPFRAADGRRSRVARPHQDAPGV